MNQKLIDTLDVLDFKYVGDGVFVIKNKDKARQNYQDAIEKYSKIPLKVLDEMEINDAPKS